MMDVVLVFGFLLLVVTFVGHGIWLLVAFVFRSLTETPQTPRPLASAVTPKRTCPHCGAWCAVTFRNCPTCGQPVAEQPHSPTAKLGSLQRQLDLLLAEEVLTLEQCESARVILQQAADRIRPPSTATSPVEEVPELPVLEAADVTEPVAEPISNLPAPVGQVEILSRKRATWTDWLQAFLEEKNIRWGELLAGLLIVGSSVGLVISLWSTLRNAIPYFPALCFLSVTAAIHGAGLYTLQHWRLKTTSRGLLTIALLLVPLNFLAAIALSEQRPATDPLYLTAVAIGVVAYGWITWSGAGELTPFGAGWLSLAVLGSAIGQLIIGRLTSSYLSTVELNSLFALPLLTYVVALLSVSQFTARWRRLTPRRVESLYRLLGIALFSLCIALGLLLWKSQAVLDTLSHLSPSVSLAAAMIVGLSGRLLPTQFVVPALGGVTQPPKGGTTNYDIAATAVTLTGTMLMVAAVVMAWPNPERLIAVGFVNFVALSWFGFATGLAPLHFPALVCLALAGLIAFHRFGEAIGGAGISESRTLLATLLLGRSGVVLSLMSLLTATVALFVVPPLGDLFGGRRNRPTDNATTNVSLAAAAGMAMLSLGIAGYAGFWPQVLQPSLDRSLPTIVFVLFGIVGLIANERFQRIEIAWAGAAVWLAAFLHAFGWNTHLREWLDGVGLLPKRPIVVALLSFATWSLGCAAVGKFRNRFVTPWSAASGRAVVVALFALPWKVWGDFGPHAIYLGWVAALCLGQAHLWQSRNLFSLSQAVAFIACGLGITSFAEQQEWWLAHGGDDVAAFLDVRHGHWQMAGLAMACAPWVLWRRFGGRWAVLARCSDWKLDRVLLPALVLLFAGQTWFGLWPALGLEISRLNSILSWRWDRVIAFLFGWGTVCWSVEEVTRSWFRRWWRDLPTPVRIPWLAEVLSLIVAFAMFVWPAFTWSRAHQTNSSNIWPRARELLFGTTAWWAAAAIVSTLAISLFDRRRWLAIAGLIAAGWGVVLHTSVWWNSRATSPSLGGNDIVTTLLWSLTGFTALVMAGSWLAEKLPRRTLQASESGPALTTTATGIALWLCLFPITLLMRLECEAWIMHARPLAVLAGQHLNPVSVALVCILPLVAWTIMLTWQATRQRSAAVIFGASHAWVLGFALIGLMMFYQHPIGHDVVALTTLLQWSVLGLGLFSLLWVWRGTSFAALAPSCFDLRADLSRVTPWLWQQLWMWGSLLLVSAIATIQIFDQPLDIDSRRLDDLIAFTSTRGLIGHLGFCAVLVAVWCAESTWANRWHSLGLMSFAWPPLLAASMSSVLFPLTWGAYHVWEFGWLVVAVGWSAARSTIATPAAGSSSWADERRVVAPLWSDAASIGVVVLAWREFVAHQSVAWSAICVAAVAACAAALAVMNRSQWRVAASIVCVVLATAMAWTRDWYGLQPRTSQQWVLWWEACIVALALAASFWQTIEVWWQARRGERFDSASRVATAHVSAGVALAFALLFVVFGLVRQLVKLSVHRAIPLDWDISDIGGWVMALAVVLPFVVSWWDRFAKTAIPGVYGSVGLAFLLLLDSRELPLGDRWWTWVSGLIAANVALVGAAWWIAKGLGVFFTPPSEASDAPLKDGNVKRTPYPVTLDDSRWIRLTEAERWLPNFQLFWAAVVSVLVIVGVLNFEPRSLRMWNVASAAVLIPGISLLACSRRRERFQQVALALGAVLAVEFVWAWMEPHLRADFWLQRSIRALEALAMTVFVYGVGLVRVIRGDSDWRVAAQRAARDVSVAAIVALMVVLMLEAWWFDPVNGAPVTGLQIALVAATLVALAVALLTMALTDGQSEISNLKFQISRSSAFFTPESFVYAAEVVVALLFLHCYLTMPELFRGYLQPYWPMIVMAIAFAGVGASELCQRATLSVLSEPFQNSAALLPLIPALGFWVATSRTDYSTVLFAGGLVYVWLNLRRRSFWYVLAASLAGNAGLWALWSEHGVELLVRPQVWLIPPAVSVLAAAQWNRQRLTEAQLAAIRYPAITLIYVSSAGEMFMTGIAESFWLPVVLMVLSVVGVLAGIWLRVRAFLYLGVSFLLLSLVSMVWHAAEAIDHTWPWWAFGIGLGLGVLTLFGLFERKRNELLRLLGELKLWER